VLLRRLLQSLALTPLLGVPPTVVALDVRATDTHSRVSAPRERATSSKGGPLDAIPVHFEPNRGQDESNSRFVARRDGWQVSILPDGASYRILGESEVVISQRIRGADPDAIVHGEVPLPGRSHYFLGNDSSRWTTRVPQFRGVRLRRVLPGVDLRWTGLSRGRIRYDFEFAPGVDPAVVEMEIQTAGHVGLAIDGSLEIRVASGVLRHSRPVAWQVDGTRRLPVECRFQVSGRRVSFSTGRIDPTLPLIIDPTVELEFLEDGGATTRGYGTAIDDDGNLLLAGETTGLQFPTKNPLQSTFGGSRDLFACKFSPGGEDLLWSTYLGGIDGETLYDMALGPDDSVFLCGYTGTSGGANAWPVKNAFQSSPGGGFRDGALAKLGPDGDVLVYASYLGGDSIDDITAVAIDADGQARVAGFTHSRNFPLVNPIYGADESFESPGSNTGFLAKVSASGSTLMASTYLGSVSPALGVAVDAAGEVWVVGVTSSSQFQTYKPIQLDLSGNSDAFVMKVSEDHKFVLFSSYFGGSGDDSGRGVEVDADGDAVVVGFTASDDFPETNGLAGDPIIANAFVARIDGESFEVEWATALGGSSGDQAFDLAIDGAGGIVVTGQTTSSDFPTVNPTQATHAGFQDMFVTRLSPDGAEVTFSTYYGWSTRDFGEAVATDGAVILVHGLADGGAAAASFRMLFEGLAAVATSGDEVDLSWGEPHSGPFDVEVQRRIGSGAYSQVAVLEPGSTAWSDLDVEEETPYEYRVRGVAEGGVTAWTSPPALTNPPLSPGSLAASATSNRSVTLSWIDRTTLETGYEIRRRAEPGGTYSLLATQPAGTQTAIDGTAVPDAVYTYSVGARGASGALGESTVLVSMPPADPGAFSVVGLSDVEVRTSWTDVSTTESGFEVQRRDDDAGGAFETVGTTAAGSTSFIDEGVEGDHGYSYRCRAVSPNGTSEWSPERSMRTPPKAPSALQAQSPTPEQVELSWVDESSSETGFRVQRRPADATEFEQFAIRPVDTTSIPVDGLLQETAYVFRVQSFGAWGNSAWIETQAVSTPAQLMVSRARLTPARGSRAARLLVSAAFDLGEADVALAGPATVRIGEALLPISGFDTFGKSGALRHESDSLEVTLRPARSGSSTVSMDLKVRGTELDELEPDGLLRLAFESGGFVAAGGVTLDAGRFDLRKGRGERETPTVALRGFRAEVRSGTAHSIALDLSLLPDPGLDTPPPVTVSVGNEEGIAFPANRFVRRGRRWILDAPDLGARRAVYDPARGTLRLRAGGLDLGDFVEGHHAVRIEVNLGPDRFVDTPVLACDGKRLRF